MLEQLKTAAKVVGAKQVRRAVQDGRAARVFLAEDAASQITQPLRMLCEEHAVPVEEVLSMKELGQACGIAVGAAVAALVA